MTHPIIYCRFCADTFDGAPTPAFTIRKGNAYCEAHHMSALKREEQAEERAMRAEDFIFDTVYGSTSQGETP